MKTPPHNGACLFRISQPGGDSAAFHSSGDDLKPATPTPSTEHVAGPTIDQRVFHWLPTIFAVLCCVLGGFYVFTTPPLQVPDEFAHLFRAYGLSEGHFVAPVLTPIPESVQRLVSEFPPHLEAVRKVTVGDLFAKLQEPLKPEDQSPVTNEGMNVNSWVPYVPSALAILVARLLHASPLAILYLGRLANLAGYTVLVWLALRVLPSYRFVLFAIALMPMVLHQAASLSWDSIAFGIAFLFCALVVRYATSASTLERRDCIVLFISVTVVSLCKVDFVLLLLLLVIPVTRFRSRKRQLVFMALWAAGAAATSMSWQYANRQNLLLFKQSITAQFHTNFPDNVWYLYYNTGYLANALARTITQDGFFYLTEFVGKFGWLFVQLPAWAVLTYLALLIFAGLTAFSSFRFSWFQRGILLSVVLAGSFACLLAMWLETPDFYIQSAILHNIGTLYGIQGRHFIPFAFAALLLVSNARIRIRASWVLTPAVLVILAVNVAGLVAIRQAYYAPLTPAAHALQAQPALK